VSRLRRARIRTQCTDQAKTAAASVCGKEKPYHIAPWFWCEQYDIKLQIAGLNQGYDQVVVRGNRDESRNFVVFYRKGGVFTAADCVNRPQAFVVCKRLVVEPVHIDPVRLADETVVQENFFLVAINNLKL